MNFCLIESTFIYEKFACLYKEISLGLSQSSIAYTSVHKRFIIKWLLGLLR